MVPERGELQILILTSGSTYPIQRLGQVFRVGVATPGATTLSVSTFPYAARCPINLLCWLGTEKGIALLLLLGQTLRFIDSSKKDQKPFSSFADFSGTMGLSDFSRPFIVVLLLSWIHDAGRAYRQWPSVRPPSFHV